MYLLQDFKGESVIKTIWRIIVGYPEQAVFIYRLSSWMYIKKIKPIAYLLKSLNVILNSCDISPSSKIGRGMKIEHSVGIVIGNNVEIDDKLRLFQNVTIGARNGNEYPKIGSNATIYAGAAVLGDIELGNNVIVGANAVVLNSLNSNSVVVGIPAREIKKK